MTTTSLKLDDQLKSRLTAAARAQGLSPHAFMVDAIQQATRQAEQRAAFVADALKARQEARESGEGYEADAVHHYLKERIAGAATDRPEKRRWRG